MAGGVLLLRGRIAGVPPEGAVLEAVLRSGDAEWALPEIGWLPLPNGGARFALSCRLGALPVELDAQRDGGGPWRLRLHWRQQPAVAAEYPLHGRWGIAQAGWFADGSWCRSPNAAAAFAPAMAEAIPTVLLVGTALPPSEPSLEEAAFGPTTWQRLSSLAAALQAAGWRVVYLHHGEWEACQAAVAPVLAHMDLLHHHMALPPRRWSAELAGAFPAPDKPLQSTLGALCAAISPALIVADGIETLGMMGKAQVEIPCAVLLSRALARAPRMIFAPLPRLKAAASLRNFLADTSVIVEDEGLRLEVSGWRHVDRAVVLPAAETPKALCAGWDAAGFCAALGLPALADATQPGSGWLGQILQLRVGSGRIGYGLYVEPWQPAALALVAAGREVLGQDRVFCPAYAVTQLRARPVEHAARQQCGNMLADLSDPTRGAAVAQRILAHGIKPFSLLPDQDWEDREALRCVAGIWGGVAASIGEFGATGRLALFRDDSEMPQVLELVDGSDTERASLLSLFPASDPRFWERPPRAVGYRTEKNTSEFSLNEMLPGACAGEALVAAALHLGCASLTLPATWRARPEMNPALRAMQQQCLSFAESLGAH